MSGACAGSPTDWRQRADFEYREDANYHPVPVSLFASEQYSGTEIFLRREQLLALKRAPFGVGQRDLLVTYAANAELSCFAALGWPFPCNVLDLYVETIASINGRSDIWPQKGRPGLLAALELHGLPALAADTKTDMRRLILDNIDYTPKQWRHIEDYNRSDTVAGTVPLLDAMARSIDLPRALHRARYMMAVARQERLGLPIDGEYLARLAAQWEQLQRYFIARDDEFRLYDGTAFREQRLWDLIEARHWDWPRTEHGRPGLQRKVSGTASQALRRAQAPDAAARQHC